jgi:ATP adenylyltransferase
MTENDALCPYCAGFLADTPSSKLYDSILIETKNFVVVPSRGSIVEGWLLVVPKRHILSIAQLSPDEYREYSELVTKLKSKVESIWGVMPTLFEHGPSHEKDLIGCGINHAHLHMVPLYFSLSDAIKSSNVYVDLAWYCLEADRIPPKHDIGERSYLFYAEPNRAANIAFPDKEVSQYFRRVIAEHVGMSEYYDYKEYDFDEKITQTVRKFKHSSAYDPRIEGRLAKAV